MSQTLEAFREYLKKLNRYNRINSLLSWDMYTATPRLGYQSMADALTWFSSEAFALSTSDELQKLLEALAAPEEYEQLDEACSLRSGP